MYTIRLASETIYYQLVDIWESAVMATHDFLKKEDYFFYKSQLIKNYFPEISLYVYYDINDKAQGFIGIKDRSIVMLFVHNSCRRNGVGKRLLSFGIKNYNVNKVSVNEQNVHAVEFYKQCHFIEYSRSEIDTSLKPYPILFMKLVS